MDELRRFGDPSRKSLFVPLALYARVMQDGWVEHTSTFQERIVVFFPCQLARYVQVRAEEAGTEVAADQLRATGT